MTKQYQSDRGSASTPTICSLANEPHPSSGNGSLPLGLSGVATVTVAMLYGLWTLALAVLVEGQLMNDAMQLRGIDMTSAEQILAAYQDPSLADEVALLRVASKSYWFTVRHASMSLLSLLVVISLLRRWPTSTHWLALLAIAVPTSMLIAVVGAPLADKVSGIGMVMGSVVGGAGLWVLWWFNRRRLRASAVAAAPNDWWLRSAAPVAGICVVVTFLVGWGLEAKLDKPSKAASSPEVDRREAITTQPSHPPHWTVHRPLPSDAKQPSVSLATPAEWELGNPGFGGSVFVALPPQLDSGNVVVRIVPVSAGLDIWAESAQTFRSGFLQSASLIYTDMHISDFKKGTLTTGQRRIDLTYSATTVANTTVEGQMRLAVCPGFLVTLHVEARTIPAQLKAILKTVTASMGLQCR